MRLKIQRLLILFITGCAMLPVWAAEKEARPMLGLSVAAAEMHFDGFSSDQGFVPVYRLGVVLESSRIHAEWSVHSWQDAETVVIRASYDRLLDLTTRTSLFAGAHASLIDLKLASVHQQPVYVTGPGFGAQAGVINQLGKGWYLEAGGRYSRYSLDTHSELLGRVAVESMAEGYLALLFVY